MNEGWRCDGGIVCGRGVRISIRPAVAEPASGRLPSLHMERHHLRLLCGGWRGGGRRRWRRNPPVRDPGRTGDGGGHGWQGVRAPLGINFGCKKKNQHGVIERASGSIGFDTLALAA